VTQGRIACHGADGKIPWKPGAGQRGEGDLVKVCQVETNAGDGSTAKLGSFAAFVGGGDGLR
jgi:hypothetical protein